MIGFRILLTGALTTLLVVHASAQYPRLVQDDWTGTVNVFLDQAEANQLRADLAQRVVDAGHDTVTQITLCGPDRESMEESLIEVMQELLATILTVQIGSTRQRSMEPMVALTLK